MTRKLTIKGIIDVFHQSKVNGADYKGDELPVQRWDWPTDTYLQRKLRRTADVELADGGRAIARE
jgi:hypothetical protein